MTKNVLISLLKQGNNGNEILQILDALTSGDGDNMPAQISAQPTLESIEF